jgi:hypothetical protein
LGIGPIPNPQSPIPKISLLNADVIRINHSHTKILISEFGYEPSKNNKIL